MFASSNVYLQSDLRKYYIQLLPWRSSDQDSPSPGVVGLIPGQGARIPQACGQKTKHKNRSNIVTNSIKTFKKRSTSKTKSLFKKRKKILHLGNKRKCYEKRLNLQQNLTVFKNMIAKIKNTIDRLRKESHSEKKNQNF